MISGAKFLWVECVKENNFSLVSREHQMIRRLPTSKNIPYISFCQFMYIKSYPEKNWNIERQHGKLYRCLVIIYLRDSIQFPCYHSHAKRYKSFIRNHSPALALSLELTVLVISFPLTVLEKKVPKVIQKK